MKKKLLFATLAAGLILTFTACSKDDTKKESVEGFWTGDIVLNNVSTPYAALFRSNGTLRVYNANADTSLATKSEGTYTLANGTVKTTYKPISGNNVNTFFTSSTANANLNVMQGVWGFAENALTTGTLTLNKK